MEKKLQLITNMLENGKLNNRKEMKREKENQIILAKRRIWMISFSFGQLVNYFYLLSTS